MIHYQLRCSREHEFDGWFKDSGTFDKQTKRGLVECPACGDATVVRALMAPSVAKRSAAAVVPKAAAPASPPSAEPSPQPVIGGGPIPAHLRVLLRQMRREIERNCDYVGSEFADEARKIHRGESEPRGIYGEATKHEAEALADEGIEVANIPWVPPADS